MQLKKAVNDAQAVGDALQLLKFQVIRGRDLGRQGMIDKLAELTDRLEPGDTAAFFYAGHGVAIDGVNYLVPTDVPPITIDGEARARGASIAEGYVVAELQKKGVRVALLVLDACRDNPFPHSLTRSVGNTRGLTLPEPARGIFTIYSAGIGQTALDGLAPNDSNRNSVFTRVFLEQLALPGLDLSGLAIEVRNRVAELALSAKDRTGPAPHEQTPAYYDQMIGERVYLAGLPKPNTAVAPPSMMPLSAAEERALKTKDVFRECDKCPEMVVVPAGPFTMGSPATENDEARVPVTIARPFAVGKFAVTFDQWDACVADGGCNGYRPDDKDWGRGNRPVINVNWDDAKAYAEWLSRKTGKTYRLLSEAEREYVTRAGTTTPFWWGSSISPNQANYNTNYPKFGPVVEGDYRQRTVPVDSFEPNPWGLFNVHGNVWEWTEDCWNASNRGNLGNGSARTTGYCMRRVVRGGSWGLYPDYLRAASRSWDTTGSRNSGLGFRLARTLNP
jgi:formylglycine-generating enzyme required for sulfatase activity